MCLLRLDIWVPFNVLQLEIEIKLISHVFSASQRYMHCHKHIHTCLLDKCSRILSTHTAVSVSSLLLRVLKEFLPKFRPWQDNNKEIATRLTLTRVMAPLTCEFHNQIDISNYHLWSVIPLLWRIHEELQWVENNKLERNNTRKLTTGLILECHLCSYSVNYGEELQCTAEISPTLSYEDIPTSQIWKLWHWWMSSSNPSQ
jgi:hypothetical protein